MTIAFEKVSIRPVKCLVAQQHCSHFEQQQQRNAADLEPFWSCAATDRSARKQPPSQFQVHNTCVRASCEGIGDKIESASFYGNYDTTEGAIVAKMRLSPAVGLRKTSKAEHRMKDREKEMIAVRGRGTRVKMAHQSTSSMNSLSWSRPSTSKRSCMCLIRCIIFFGDMTRKHIWRGREEKQILMECQFSNRKKLESYGS